MALARFALLMAGSLCVTSPLMAQAPRFASPLALSAAGDSVRQPQFNEPIELPRDLSLHSLLVPRGAPHFVRLSLGAVAASALVSLADGPVMREMAEFRDPSGSAQRASVVVASIGGFAPLTIGSLLWAGGAMSHRDVVRHIGMESTQAVLLSSALTIGIKGLVGRSRPNASPDDPDQYYPGRGFLDARRSSFPSGHTSGAFALATVLSRELGGRYPARKRLIQFALYGAAGSVGIARMYQNVHWPSDVVTGAALGTLSGLQALAWHAGSR